MTEASNLAADIANLEQELGIEPCCEGVCIHHVIMEESG